MNTQPGEITIEKNRHALIASAKFGIMSTIRHSDGMISSNPVGYLWDGEMIRVSTLKSRVKYQNLLADSRIALCIVNPANVMDYIEIRGHATLADDPQRDFFRRQFMAGSGGVEPPEDIDSPAAERAIIIIHPHRVSSPSLYGGRFDKAEK
jgi:PPOX class probable F420-dependent enzyme